MDLRDTVSAVFAAAANVYSGLPFDTVKVKLQTQSGSGHVNGLVDGLRKIPVRSLFNGALPALAAGVVENGVLFTANGCIKRVFTSVNGGKDVELTLVQHGVCGALSGIFSATAITPLEIAKIRMQVQASSAGETFSGPKYRGPTHCLASIAKQEGVRGMFKGLHAAWMRDVPFAAIFLGSYEAYCVGLQRVARKASKDSLHPVHLFIAGGLAGATAWSVVFPADVVKSRMQAGCGQQSLRQTVSSIYRQQGMNGFFRGWSAAVARAFPANAALLLGYELCQKFWARFDEADE
eukprot:Colp12_sorted_trinity150504_noHs@16091